MSKVLKKVHGWEPISEDDKLVSHRLRVTGGWIVRSMFSEWRTGAAIAQTFVKDENHAWKLDEPSKKSRKERS